MLKISIITVNFNNQAGLRRTLQSLAEQNNREWESVVIDGGSTDGSTAVITEYESRIAYSVSETDRGAYHAMNKGIAKANGDYLLFLNSGDHFAGVDSLQTAVDHLDGTGLIAFDILVEGNGRDYIKKHPDAMRFSFLFNDTLAHQSVLIKRSLFDTYGLYDDSLKITADWKFFTNALYRGATYKAVHSLLTVYYLDGMSATAKGTFKRREERKQILEQEYGLFYEDYKQADLLNTNRFRMLRELESSKAARKLNSAWLMLLLRLFKNRSLKNLP